MILTAMEILERCRRAEAEKRRLQEKVDMIRDMAVRMTSSLSGAGARSTGGGDHMAAMMARLEAAEQDVQRRDREYTAEVAAACQLLDRLPPLECSILTRYYIRGETLRAISKGMGYSYGYICNSKTTACRQLKDLGEGEVMRLLPTWYIMCAQKCEPM